MWRNVSIKLDANGAGSTRVPVATQNALEAMILAAVYIPVQTAVNSGTTDVIVNHLMLNDLKVALYTLTNPATPYFQNVQRLVYDQAGVVTTAYAYSFVQDLDVTIASGVANETVSLYLMLA